jgi:hypothetical protein
MIKWGHSYEIEDTKDRLLQYVVQHVILSEVRMATCMNPRLGYALNKLFRVNGGWLGDPLCEITHTPLSGTLGSFDVYASDEFSGIGLENGTYPAEEVVDVLTQLLVAYGVEYPHENYVIAKILPRIPAYREQLRT